MKRIGSICLLGIGSGLAISIGGTVYLSVENPVVGSVLFAVGLYAVVLNGLYLYTGKIGYLVEQKEKKRTWNLPAVIGRYKYVLLVVAAGILCLLWPSGGGGSASGEGGEELSLQAGGQEEMAQIQTEMAEILGKIKGVGQVEVMLTLDRGAERVLAGDSSLSYSGATSAPDDYSRDSETVVISQNGDDSVVVTQEIYPQFRGALVVCQGGGNPEVQLSVIQAVSALTGLGADKITVVEWQS